jgi:hypothetical protein
MHCRGAVYKPVRCCAVLIPNALENDRKAHRFHAQDQ